ncbi:MAG TPA: DUF4424 domain-containing protein [Pararhizobium sp.]|uniref:DUF4424 domain-containing protein n=1 Tax=Pararhizobium sp. TaxID=1977563 RepID=UPI002C1D02B1|nr:DUF4424 domain-containing protein [Pararhizobium sp.]HTO32911.1 DUF4424 domain-containing protein [Pararhizobium sp.]
MRVPYCLLAIALLPSAALANDTMADLKTGGLTYVQTLDVEMVKEDLFISRDEVRVDYVFRNTTDKPVSGIVAFPMPDITGGMNENIAMDDMQADNFLGFSVTQDGEPVNVELEQRAIANSLDVTDALQEQDVPLLPFADATAEALADLDDDVATDFKERGMLFNDVYDDGDGMKEHRTPIWTLRSAYWWKATFPPGRDIHVSHRYKPSVGGTVAVTFLDEGKPQGERFEDYKARYCIDDAFVKATQKLPPPSDDGQTLYTEAWISYILTTGNNWGGPIKSFTLTVDKGDPRNLISFCSTGVKKTGPTTFRMMAEDFSPQKDLEILILQHRPDE